MKIKVQTRHLALTSELKEYVKRRILFALDSRFDKIKRVIVTLSDINGPKGGEDMRCQVLVKLDGQKDIVIDHKQAHLRSAIDKAADKASRTVTKRIERLQHKATRINSALRRMTPKKASKPDIYEEYENEYGYYQHS
ncbi:HPF/RaiA family ribosome-associated protein [Marinomonas algicola]|uniref:HPF/RaiA family ribosome-associated protein n=1 Tax=Marinomonas algicola TaxID=2773454 RepID=UPI001748ACA0|nr:HPF/RaiA family ribosome-associated protein [Marinomonas algicola]